MTDQEVTDLLLAVRPAVTRIAKRFYNDPDLLCEIVQQHALLVWEQRERLCANRNPRAFVIAKMYYVCMGLKDKDRTRQNAGFQAGGYEGLTDRFNIGERDDDAIEELESTSQSNPLSRGSEHSTLRDLDIRLAVKNLTPLVRHIVLSIMLEGRKPLDLAHELGISRIEIVNLLNDGILDLQTQLQDWRGL
jgi:DNA-directed RNA polymerase specialized sigma24 family protein